MKGCLADAYVRATLTNRTTQQAATGLLCDAHEKELGRNSKLTLATESLHSDDPSESVRVVPEAMTPLRFQQRVRELAAETAAPTDSLWWLSFTDPELPKGNRFMGACIVIAGSLPAAITRSHVLGINPGGEVMTIGPLAQSQVPSEYPVEQLLSREQIDKLDEMT